MAEISSKEGWKTSVSCQNRIKKTVRKPWIFLIFAWFLNFFLWYLSHLLMDFYAKQRFGNVINCRLHNWNLDLKFKKFHNKVGLRSRSLLKKIGLVTKFSWITFKLMTQGPEPRKEFFWTGPGPGGRGLKSNFLLYFI
jgi:hypothetical protein